MVVFSFVYSKIDITLSFALPNYIDHLINCYNIYLFMWGVGEGEGGGWLVGVMVSNATFNNISIISWRSVLLAGEIVVT